MRMINNIFQAKYKSLELWRKRSLSDLERFVPSFYKRGIQVYPHQIDAAVSALFNPYSKGFILCDETGLGKAIEAMLVISQLYFEGKNKIVVISPNPLIAGWREKLNKFDILSTEHLEEVESANKVLVIGYNAASDIWEQLKGIKWDLVVFEEAHRLRKYYTNENIVATNLHNAFIGRQKLLLTATPMQVNVMDLFGLINFIDDTVFIGDKNFYKRYYKKPENYAELRDRLMPFTYRTLRNQVKVDICLPERYIHTQHYTLNEKEQELYKELERYINKPNKIAFPEMDLYELSLMFFKLFSSSIYALSKTLSGVYFRLNQMGKAEAIKEAVEIKKLLDLSTSIVNTSKWEVFIKGLSKGLEELKAKGNDEKAIIFTENKQTQEYILRQLNKEKIKAITFESVEDIEKFKKSKTQIVMVATDLASEGFDMQFCSFIINYDLPWNVQKIEQRIGRCHRIGQQSEVFVLNFLNNENFADVRFYELVYKRTTMFEGILGASDNLISNVSSGDVEQSLKGIISSARTNAEIESDFLQIQNVYKDYVEESKDNSNELLFNTFDDETAKRTKNYAEIIKKKCEKLKDELWDFCKYAFNGYGTIDEENKIILVNRSPFSSGNIPSWKLCMEGNESKDRIISLSNNTVKKIADKIDLSDRTEGKITFIDSTNKHSKKSGYIALYKMQVYISGKEYSGYSILHFVGIDSIGNQITHDKCSEIFNLKAESNSEEKLSESVCETLTNIFENQKQVLIENANQDNLKWIAIEVN